MTIRIPESLELLPYQASIITSPRIEEAARAATDLTSAQEAVKLGEPIPIIFCRRRSGNGGVFVSPKATEARFENNVQIDIVSQTTSGGTVIAETRSAREYLDVKFRVVLTEGDMPLLDVTNLFSGNCKVGTWAQKYDQRAGTWDAGNFIDDYLTDTIAGQDALPEATAVAGDHYYLSDTGYTFHYYTSAVGSTLNYIRLDHTNYNAPEYCGTSGSYDNLTNLSFERRFLQLENYDRQIHAFVPEGMKVTRLVDSTLGSSDNFVDLAKYLIDKTSAVPSDLIDTTLFTAAANFCDVNGFLYNGVLTQSQNLSDWLQSNSIFFLLRFAKVDGKYAFRPVVPMNADYTIKTTAVSYEYTFTENDLLADGFEIVYMPISERSSVIMQILWREQPDNDVSIPRSAEVKFSDTTGSVPYEQHDLSEFCTNEDHAVKVGAYMLSRRRNITHSLRITTRPGVHGGILSTGDLVRVRLRRETGTGNVDYHDFLYEIVRIEKQADGVIIYDLIHFPIDTSGRSLVARDVASASGNGVTLSTGRVSADCDKNTVSATVTEQGSAPPSDAPVPSDVEVSVTPASLPASGGLNDGTGGAPPTDQPDNPTDPYAEAPAPTITGYSGTPTAGDTLTFSPGCVGAYITWYKININTDTRTLIGSGIEATLDVTAALQQEGVRVLGIGRCPDPSSSDGYGLPIETDTVDVFDEIVSCPGGGDAGGQGTFTKVIDVGTAYPASFTFSYNAFTIPDKFIISGAATLDTGYVSGSSSVTVNKTSANRYITVTVEAPTSGTNWNYTVGCAS